MRLNEGILILINDLCLSQLSRPAIRFRLGNLPVKLSLLLLVLDLSRLHLVLRQVSPHLLLLVDSLAGVLAHVVLILSLNQTVGSSINLLILGLV